MFAASVGAAAALTAPVAQAAPAPEVEYTYDVVVRRHYAFPNNDAITYGYGICEKVRDGEGYSQVMSEVKGDTLPNDEFAANYLVSNASGNSLSCADLAVEELRGQLRAPAGGVSESRSADTRAVPADQGNGMA